jgi:hypothetical protein
VTPWGDVITLVRSPATQPVKEQFGDLPRVVRNIIKLRRDRADLQMLPVYVNRLDKVPLEVDEPTSLMDELSPEEQESLEGWAASLGSTTATNADTHKATRSTTTSNTEEEDGMEEPSHNDSNGSGKGDDEREDSEKDEPPMDDPVAWLIKDMDKTEERINDR